MRDDFKFPYSIKQTVRLHDTRVGISNSLFVIVAFFIAIRIVQWIVPDAGLQVILNPTAVLHHAVTPWQSENLGGPRTPLDVDYIPIGLIYEVLRSLSGPIGAERDWFALLLICASFGMRTLYWEFWGNRAVLAGTVAGILYAVSPFFLLSVRETSTLVLPYVMAPIVIWAAYRTMQDSKWQHLAWFALGCILASPGTNPPASIPMLTLCIVLIIALSRVVHRSGHGIQNSDNVQDLLLRHSDASPRALTLTKTLWSPSIRLIVIGLGSALWWAVPLVTGLSGKVTTVQTYFYTPLSRETSFSSVYHVSALEGLWTLYLSNIDPMKSFLTGKWFVAAGWGVFIFTIYALVSIRRSIFGRFLLGIMLFSMWMSVGTNKSGWLYKFSSIYNFLYVHSGYFRGFHSVYDWVGPIAFAYALIAPYGAHLLYQRWRHRSDFQLINRALPGLVSVATTGALVLACIFWITPYASGRVFPIDDLYNTPPNYWQAVANYLNKTSVQGRVLVLPIQAGYTRYTWGLNAGPSIATQLLSAPVLSIHTAFLTGNSARNLYSPLTTTSCMDGSAENANAFNNALAEFGVEFIILRNDVTGSGCPSGSAWQPALQDLLARDSSMVSVFNAGELSVIHYLGPRLPMLGVMSASTYSKLDSNSASMDIRKMKIVPTQLQNIKCIGSSVSKELLYVGQNSPSLIEASFEEKSVALTPVKPYGGIVELPACNIPVSIQYGRPWRVGMLLALSSVLLLIGIFVGSNKSHDTGSLGLGLHQDTDSACNPISETRRRKRTSVLSLPILGNKLALVTEVLAFAVCIFTLAGVTAWAEGFAVLVFYGLLLVWLTSFMEGPLM